jgi:hypothetical protein
LGGCAVARGAAGCAFASVPITQQSEKVVRSENFIALLSSSGFPKTL